MLVYTKYFSRNDITTCGSFTKTLVCYLYKTDHWFSRELASSSRIYQRKTQFSAKLFTMVFKKTDPHMLVVNCSKLLRYICILKHVLHHVLFNPPITRLGKRKNKSPSNSLQIELCTCYMHIMSSSLTILK